MKGYIVSALVVLALVQLMIEPGQAIKCPEVDGYLTKCVPYLNAGGEPEAACCNGVKSLVAALKTPADKRDACNCVKDAANQLSRMMQPEPLQLANAVLPWISPSPKTSIATSETN
nr:non-specific lipid-transfer protein AP10-like [Coffea arabica]